MNIPAILTLLRYLLTFGGGFLVAKGYLDEASLEQVIGGIISIASVAAGVFVNSKNSATIAAAQTVLEQAPSPVTRAEVAVAAAEVQK